MLDHRRMLPKDVRPAVDMLAEHPRIGPLYGRHLDDLRVAWLELLGCDAMTARVLEERDGRKTRISFVGVAVCVHDRFLEELKTGAFWCGPELARRVAKKKTPVPTDNEVREANSSAGLNLVVWSGYFRPELEKQSAPYREMMGAFIEEHRGYRWKEVIASEMENAERLQWTLNSGGMIWNPKTGSYTNTLPKPADKIIQDPHVVGITREIENARPGSWVGELFDYRPPRIYFTRGQQQLLSAALEGLTDEELASRLHVSVPTVKKTWHSIYQRALPIPDLFPKHISQSGDPLQRGREKRRRLLAYLRKRPEELRPIRRLAGHKASDA